MAKLDVKIDNKSSGELIYENKEFIYSYKTEEKSNFISLTMPVRSKDYVYNKLHPIFEMHLPEGYLLSIIKKHFSKIKKMDDFGLLEVMSGSIKGRISYKSNLKKIDNNLSLDELIHPKNNMLFNELVERFSLNSPLSGVQPKVLASIENKATLKFEDYIVKSWGDDYKELALNEYYCMNVVKQANIPTSKFYISDDDKLFIMKRFDKKDDGKYLGFEDMCVLLAKQRDDKYEGTYEQIAKVIKTYVSNKNKKNALYNFYKMTIINFLLKNGDAHLKNFGLIYDGIENIDLAYAYDVVNTTIYIKNDIPALHLLGSKKWWDKKYLIRFGIESCNLTKKETKDGLNECIDAIKKVSKDILIRIECEKNNDKKEFLKSLYEVFSKAL